MSFEVFPVIHAKNEQQVVDQANLSFDNGADGVYLISHSGCNAEVLAEYFNSVKKDHPNSFVGVNFLDIPSAAESLKFIANLLDTGRMKVAPDGLWVDDVIADADDTKIMRQEDVRLKNIRYLGGISFKYLPEYSDDPIESAAEVAKWGDYVDVITTSGPGTGLSPSKQKILAMKAASSNKPLAIASGVDANNLQEFSGIADQLLVSTSLETSPYSGEFDQQKLREFIELAHSK